ncbi:hypothetical protein F4811DRAFT_76339 [Daldinia bambusicola]|nr:hypothetical protein F4811DRAFT_76339 [Daldinia bambusicola]
MESKTSRYQSRILREMHQNTENPFNSPPSSTGSHGTVTLTSNITGPQGESTRRMDDLSIELPSQAAMRSAKAPQPSSLNINTSVLGRTFPEWSRWNPNGHGDEKEMWETASDDLPVSKGKENVTPLGSPNSSAVATPRAEETNRDKVSKHFLDYIKHRFATPRIPVSGLETLESTSQDILNIAERFRDINKEVDRATHAARIARTDRLL